MNASGRILRVAAMADVHYRANPPGPSRAALYQQVSEAADVLVICGDLTDYGMPDEAQLVVRELAAVRIPIVAVLGNHDYESGNQAEVSKTLIDAGIHLLDGESCEIGGVGFAGCKGFCGGFGKRTLEPWGESIIKRFVQEACDESLKLESALARLRTPQKIAVLHYAPVQMTVEGEPPEIYAFLGSSRMEDPINRYEVHTVFHGHAHRGTFRGQTSAGIPVYNVSVSLLERTFPDKPLFHLIEVPVDGPAT